MGEQGRGRWNKKYQKHMGSMEPSGILVEYFVGKLFLVFVMGCQDEKRARDSILGEY